VLSDARIYVVQLIYWYAEILAREHLRHHNRQL